MKIIFLLVLLTISVLAAEKTDYTFNGFVTSGKDSLTGVQVKIFIGGDSLNLSSDSNGWYDGTISITSISRNQPPKQFELMGSSYPNPFNPSTTIPVFGDGYLTVINVLGQEVFSKAVQANIKVNAAGLAAGIYFARYVSKNNPEQVMVKKMILIDGGNTTFNINHTPITNLSNKLRKTRNTEEEGDSTRYQLSKEGYFDLDTTIITHEGTNNQNFTLKPIPTNNWFLLTSNVTDKQGTITGANIKYQPTGQKQQEKTTNQKGEAKTDTMWTTNNTIDIITTTTKTGYEQKQDTLTITPGNNWQDIRITQTPTTIYNYVIKGQITDEETGEGIEGTLITIKAINKIDSTYSDEEGFYEADTIKTEQETIEANINTFKEGYEDFAKKLLNTTPGTTTENIKLTKIIEDHQFGATMFNQRGITITTGTIKLRYNNKTITIPINNDGTFNATIPGEIKETTITFENEDYTEYIAIRTPNQGPSKKNITQSNYLWIAANTFEFDSAKINLKELDQNPQKNNLYIYSIADTALNDTARSILSHAGGGHTRFTEPYTVEILNIGFGDGGSTVREKDKQQRIKIFKDNQKNAILLNNDTLITMNYITVEADGIGHQPINTTNWVHFYQNNDSQAGHTETQDDPNDPFRTTYGGNHIKASNNFNTMGAEYYGNHFIHDGLAGNLGSYCIKPDGTLTTEGIDMLGTAHIFDTNTNFNPEQK